MASFVFVAVGRGGRENTPVNCEISDIVFE